MLRGTSLALCMENVRPLMILDFVNPWKEHCRDISMIYHWILILLEPYWVEAPPQRSRSVYPDVGRRAQRSPQAESTEVLSTNTKAPFSERVLPARLWLSWCVEFCPSTNLIKRSVSCIFVPFWACVHTLNTKARVLKILILCFPFVKI